LSDAIVAMNASPAANSAAQGVLVTDFDGTITRFDFYDLVSRAYPEIAGQFWQQYEAGELSHFEALRRIFAGIRAPEEELLAVIRAMRIEPRLSEAVALLERRGWKIIVASAGCEWYIQRLLADAKVSLEVHANPGTYSPAQGLEMRLPDSSPFLSAQLGINKVAVVREALRTSGRVAFAGDGRPDLAPALLVQPEGRFARKWLARKLAEIGERFQPFESWLEIAQTLTKPTRELA
jgi:2-hydroxy-3-keto-5-methylthiopentenyl-1-phosphate phosphatase